MGNSTKSLLFIGVSALILCFASPIFSRTWTVCPDCSNSSVSETVRKSQSGDRIEVEAGTYKVGSLKIDKKLELIGRGHPTLDGELVGDTLLITSDGVTIEGFLITGSGQSDIDDFAGIKLDEVGDFAIRNNVILLNTYGVFGAKAKNGEISHNLFYGNAETEVMSGNGIHLWYCNHISLQKNTIINHRDGLYFEFSEDMEIRNNKVEGNFRYGMHFMFSHRNHFLENKFRKNATGVAIMYSKHLIVEKNEFADSLGLASYGLLIKEIQDTKFFENKFYGNTVAVYADNSNRNTFIQNEFRDNSWAVQMLGSSDDNSFTDNVFIENDFDVATNSRHNTNVFAGNFWDHYSGYDLTGDGVGDIPYRPVPIFSYWMAQFPVLVVLLDSPFVDFLEFSERTFPVLSPTNMVDESPKVRLQQGS